MHDTKIEYDSDNLEVTYFSYEGNNLPLIGVCRLTEKVRNLVTPSSVLKVGLLGGFLEGNCGYFVNVENKSKQVSQAVTLYRSQSEFSGA